MMSTKIVGREYIMGRGRINPTGRTAILVIDVAADRVVSVHQKAHAATDAMIAYATENDIKTQMAIASSFGEDMPLIVTETY